MLSLEQALNQEGYPAQLNSKSEELFLYACKEGHARAVELYLQLGISPNAPRDQYGSETPLIKATEGGNLELIRLLVEAGADLEAKDNSEDTALMTALNWSQEPAFRLLLELDADPNTRTRHRVSLLEKLLKDKPSWLDPLLASPKFSPQGDGQGLAPLALALEQNNKSLWQKLLAAGLDCKASLDEQGNSPLLYALLKRQTQWLQTLLDAGAEPHAKNSLGHSAASYALCHAHKNNELLALLDCQACSQNEKNRAEALRLSKTGEGKKLAALLQKEPELLQSKNEKGWDLLQIYLDTLPQGKEIQAGHFVDFLAEANWDFGKHYPSSKKPFVPPSPLWLCIRQEQFTLLRQLCELGLAMNDEEGHCGMLANRAYALDKECIKLFLKHGANINSRQGHDNLTLLYNISYHKGQKSLDICTLALKEGIELDAQCYGKETALIHAAKYKNSELVELLIQAGAKLDKADQYSETALHQCAKGYNSTDQDWASIARMLLKAGADFSLVSNFGNTAFQAALSSKNQPCLEVFYEFAQTCSSEQFSKLGIYKQLELIAILLEKENFSKVEFFLQRIDSVPRLPKCSKPLLVQLVQKKHQALLALALEKGADPNELQMYGGSALTSAVEELENMPLVELLLRHGANPNSVGYSGETPLHSALGPKAGLAMLQRLEDAGGAIPRSYTGGFSLLMRAIQSSHKEALLYLLEKGCPAFSRNNYGHSTLSLAIDKRDTEALALLLDKKPLLDFSGYKNMSPLVQAIGAEAFEEAKILLRAGASLEFRDGSGKNALDYIQMRDSLRKEFADFLPQKQKKSKIELSKMDFSVSPLWASVYADDFPRFQQLVEEEDADVDERNFMQETPLMLLSCKGKVAWMRFCIEQGADAQAKNTWAENALGYISLAGDEESEQLLKDAGLQLDMDTLNARAAQSLRLDAFLGFLKRGDILEAVAALAERKINPYSVGKQGLNVLNYSIQKKEKELTKALLDLGIDPNIADAHQSVALLQCIYHADSFFLRMLHKAGARLDNKANTLLGSFASAALHAKQKTMLKYILDHCPELGSTMSYGQSLLHEALLYQVPTAFFKLLLDYMNIDSPNEQGISCFAMSFSPHLDFSKRSLKRIRDFLYEAGANPNYPMPNAMSLLAWALHQNLPLEELRALLDYGANPKYQLQEQSPSAYTLAEQANAQEHLDLFKEFL